MFCLHVFRISLSNLRAHCPFMIYSFFICGYLFISPANLMLYCTQPHFPQLWSPSRAPDPNFCDIWILKKIRTSLIWSGIRAMDYEFHLEVFSYSTCILGQTLESPFSHRTFAQTTTSHICTNILTCFENFIK